MKFASGLARGWTALKLAAVIAIWFAISLPAMFFDLVSGLCRWTSDRLCDVADGLANRGAALRGRLRA